jgi:Na+-transporting NADH:ubiquinone oxidoreductase subunit NqrF
MIKRGSILARTLHKWLGLLVGLQVLIWLGLSGFNLLFFNFNRHDFHFLNVSGKQVKVSITPINPQTGKPNQIKLKKGSNLLLSLHKQKVKLPSICDGGGESGKCRVRFEDPGVPETNSVEEAIIPRRLREQGWRLASQQVVSSNVTLALSKGTQIS